MKLLAWFERTALRLNKTKSDRAIETMSPLEQFEIRVLEAAAEHGTTISVQREHLGAIAPEHEFCADADLRCSVCRREFRDH